MVRFVAAASVGLVAVAALEVSFRVTNAARSLAIAGSGPMLSMFAGFARGENAGLSRRFTADALAAVVFRGGLPLAWVIAFSPVIPVWLGTDNRDVVVVAQVIALWGALTLVNVPFWYELLARHNETYAAATVWIHALLLLLLVPASGFLQVSAIGIAWYWLTSSLLTQGAIMWRSHRRFDSLRPALRTRAVHWSMGLAMGALILALTALPACSIP